jgi:hypothetical protein
MGFYLQIELPVWPITINDAPQPQKFLLGEGFYLVALIFVYGLINKFFITLKKINHPINLSASEKKCTFVQ